MQCSVIKPKELLVREHIDETKVDVSILVETWLNQNDNEWCTSSELNNNGLQMDRIDRKNRNGGGIIVVCKQSIQLKRLKKGNKLDCRGAVASVRDSYTVDLSSIPVRLVVASW